jgi:hypothetical protein
MRDTMTDNAAALAERVVARDPSGFRSLVGGGAAAVHPAYDWLLKLRGRETAITLDQRHRSGVPRAEEDTRAGPARAAESPSGEGASC